MREVFSTIKNMTIRIYILAGVAAHGWLFGPLYAGQPTEYPRPEALDQLIKDAQSSERGEWWPAALELGRIAAYSNVMRDEIWRRARVNTVGMRFVRVEPGTFVMGPDFLRVFDIQPGHTVTITRPYYIGVTEVTNAQFQELFPEFVPDKYSTLPDCPAVRVTWDQAIRFCRLLSEREGVTYRLPTEAEWEYVCRAATTTRYCFGDNHIESGSDVLSEYAWWNKADRGASEVALLKPNAWGLYDMHGNACEWTADWFSTWYYWACLERGTVVDPKGPETGFGHVLRGGPWDVGNPCALTSTARCRLPLFDRRPFDSSPVGFRQTIGFRVVREVVEGEAR